MTEPQSHILICNQNQKKKGERFVFPTASQLKSTIFQKAMESLFYKHKKDQHTLMKKITTIFIKTTRRPLNERPFG